MAKLKSEPVSPNATIDEALSGLMERVPSLEPDVAVKVINSAIAWEKVKAKIQENDADFDPDNL